MNTNNLLDIMASSNSMSSPSGYGTQMALWLPWLKRAGYGVSLHCNYGLQGAPFLTQDGILCLPSVVESAGNDILLGHFQYTKSDVCLTLYDPHAYNTEVMKQFPWAAWVPVDSAPLFGGSKRSLQSARWIWAMSHFGEQQLKNAGFTNVVYVPHGIDANVFKPIDRIEARRHFATVTGVNIDDKFLIVMNAANKGTPSRKGFYEAFSAFKALLDAHDDARLYVHSEMLGAFSGENLPDIAALVGIPRERMIFAQQYQLVTGVLDQNYLNHIYNAADVFLSGSHGEGWGIPSVEAQLSGCPVVVPENSAQTELAGAGLKVACVSYMPVTGIRWQRPSVGGLAQALETAYSRRDAAAWRAESRYRAMEYSADHVWDAYMHPALEAIQRELYKPIEPQKIMKKRRLTTIIPVGVPASANVATHEELLHMVAEAISIPGSNGHV